MVFPARAGMSPPTSPTWTARASGPRASGDEPYEAEPAKAS